MKKRVFITGISGFAGSHLAELLLEQGDNEIFGTVFGNGPEAVNIPKNNLTQLNLMDRRKTLRLIEEIKPHWVFHLAALSSPSQSFQDPRGTITNNIEAQINVLDGAAASEADRVLVIGSAEEYGKVSDSEIPIDENTELNPLSPYAVSKVAQDYLGKQYFLHHKLPVIRVRPFNHTGERQAPMFVIPAFAKQIAEIEAGGKKAVIKVGNLKAIRDFTDVKDMMAAYRLAMIKGVPGDVYNLGSGKGYQIQEILGELLKLTRVKITVQQDLKRMQPSDIPQLVCDPAKFKKVTGWQASIPLSKTLERVLDYWRDQVTSNK